MKNTTFAVLASVLLVGAAGAQDPAPVEKHGLPGLTPGTEQWIVTFHKRSFDLAEFRAAMYARKPHSVVEPIVAELDRQAKQDQAPFKEAIEGLGGRVYSQWWLVNAAAIEIPFSKLGAVAKLPNVKRLWPNEVAVPHIKEATNAANHNSDAVNQSGHTGKGVATAIMDTGLDSNCGSKNRPHRTFYVDGDTSKRNRLLANLKFGRAAADNSHPHGTGVAGIVAGGKWGTSAADAGHAPEADIVGYSIANDARGSSDFTTIMNAWQGIARDASKYKTRTANNSYSGSRDPQNPSQQALDACALNADVCITISAGNFRSSTANSQACVNGIAVGATNRNAHTMASFSSRGPHSGTNRNYPDIVGNGVNTVMPDNDAETRDWRASGTSMSAPQVCGAATLIRAYDTSLKADQTKAILLATALDISTQNKSENRNAYGHGLLKDDAAMRLTMDKANHGRAAVTKANPQWQKVVTARKGRSYRVAIAWLRQDVTKNTWSNLDLEVLRGSQVIASSRTPRNLDEVAFFRAPADGAYFIRVKGVGTIQNDNQPFGWGFTEGSGPPIESEYDVFGAGCPGAPQKCNVCLSFNWTQRLSGKTTSGTRVAILETTNEDGLNICGIDLYAKARGTSPVDVTVSIHLINNQTAEPGRLLSSGKVRVGTTAGIYSAKFPVANVPKNDIYFVAFDNADKLTLPVSPSGSSGIHYEWVNNKWSSLKSDTNWQFRVQCDKGSQVPILSTAGKPILGRTFDIDLTKAKANTAALFFLGISDKQWGAFQLPVTFAAPCKLLVSGELISGLAVGGSGSAKVPVAIPNSKDLIQLQFFNQFLVRDAANAVGWISTNAGRAKIGEF